MYALQTLILFIGVSLAAPLTSENLNVFQERAASCEPRLGWNLNSNDCSRAAAKLPVTKISFTGRPMPDFSLPGLSGSDSSSSFNLPHPTTTPVVPQNRQYIVSHGECHIGVHPVDNSGAIEINDWGSIVGRVYNIIMNCVKDKQGGRDRAGLLNNIEVVVFQYSADDETS